MRSGVAQAEDGAPGVTGRVVRLLVLLGAVVAAYFVLCLFDHAARADAGSVDQSIDQVGSADPVASVEAVGAGATKAIPEPKSIIPKSTAPKAHLQRIHPSTIKVHGLDAPKIQAPKKIHAPKIQAPSIRAGETVRRVQARKAQVRTLKLRQPRVGAVRDVARAAATPARTAVVRQKLSAPAQLPVVPELAKLGDLPPAARATLTRLPVLPQAELSALPQLLLPSWPQLSYGPQMPGLPQAQPPAWPQLPSWPQPSWSQLPSWPQPSWSQLPSWPQLAGLPQARTPVLTRVTALPSSPVPHQPLMTSVFAQVCQPPAFAPALGLSGVTKPPAAQAQPRTGPLPAPPQQPADHSTSTGQARDSGGGNAPAMGTVSSSWRSEVAAAGRRVATDLIARGRTVRYAGPPS
jgi:hypothetical protein